MNQKRINILSLITQHINNWQKEYAVAKKGVTDIKQAQVLSFGSFKLGVHFPHADLDLICLFPTYITKDDFFTDFMEVLTH